MVYGSIYIGADCGRKVMFCVCGSKIFKKGSLIFGNRA